LAVLGAMHNVSYPSSSSAGSQVVMGELRAIIPMELSVLILQVSVYPCCLSILQVSLELELPAKLKVPTD